MNKILILITFWGLLQISWGCTNVLITAGASTNSTPMLAYTYDHEFGFGYLHFGVSTNYPEGAKRKVYDFDTNIYLGEIDQVSCTYTVVGNTNEYGLAITETTIVSQRKELKVNQAGAVIDYGSLIYITLERVKTVREAIYLMGNLTSQYGYYSDLGETYSLADRTEVWIMQMMGKGNYEKGAVWVARKIPDGYVSAHSNSPRIQTFPLNDTDQCIYSDDVISFARDRGWFSGEDQDFSFADVYSPLDYLQARWCDARSWEIFRRISVGMEDEKYMNYVKAIDLSKRVLPLWVKPKDRISLNETMNLLKDHYEGTWFDMRNFAAAGPDYNPYRYRPAGFTYDSKLYVLDRPIAYQETAWSMVAQIRPEYPDDIAALLWFGMDDPCTTVYIPFYSGIIYAPDTWTYNYGLQNFTLDSAFWVFSLVSNWAYTSFYQIQPEVETKANTYQNQYFEEVEVIDERYLQLYNKSRYSAQIVISEFCNNTSNNLLKDWYEFYQFLFVRYMDGKKTILSPTTFVPNVTYYGYTEEWQKRIINDTGEHYLINQSHPAQTFSKILWVI